MRSIFSEKRYFEVTDSLNAESAHCFKENPEKFLQLTAECAKKSREEFNNLPQDCPYRFDKIEKIPEDVKAILENNSVG